MMIAYNFTEGVRRTLAKAREEAGRLRHEYVGTEHLALGVLHTADGIAADALGSIDRIGTAEIIERQVGRGQYAGVEGPDLPYTARGRRVLELAMLEAAELGHSAVDVEHLLLGVLREEGGIGGRVLAAAGLELDVTRAAVRKGRGEGGGWSSGARSGRLLWRLLSWAGLAPRP